MSDNNMYSVVWALAAACFCFLVTTVNGCYTRDQERNKGLRELDGATQRASLAVQTACLAKYSPSECNDLWWPR